jgi:4-hydroxy-2-oxoglutarate aldolase
VAGILVQGSNGEAQHLSHAERARAIRLTRQVLDEHGFEKTVIIAGTGAQTTRETRLLNEEAHKAGAAFAHAIDVVREDDACYHPALPP